MQPALVETHEVVALPISPEAHVEIARLLREIGRDERFHPSDQGVLIDMSGLGLVVRA